MAYNNLIKDIKLNNFRDRFLSTLVIFPIAIFCVIAGGFFYFLLLFIVAFLAGYEWSDICGKWSFGLDGMSIITFICLALTASYMRHILLALGFLALGMYFSYISAKVRAKYETANKLSPDYINRPFLYGFGVFYIGLAFVSFGVIRNLDPYNLTTIWLFGLVVSSDVGAYLVGSIFKGRKLAPSISPGKTVSGLIGAMVVTFFVSYIFAGYINSDKDFLVGAIGSLIAVLAHVGDLLESAFKRYLKIKDTSNLIPGHGGILDRIDALAFTAIMVFIISFIIGKSILFI